MLKPLPPGSRDVRSPDGLSVSLNVFIIDGWLHVKSYVQPIICADSTYVPWDVSLNWILNHWLSVQNNQLDILNMKWVLKEPCWKNLQDLFVFYRKRLKVFFIFCELFQIWKKISFFLGSKQTKNTTTVTFWHPVTLPYLKPQQIKFQPFNSNCLW